jgi:hypothetical protein
VSVHEYPRVRGEFETVRQLLKGRSLARLGDGELKHLDGKDGGRQAGNESLKAEMRAVVTTPHADLIVGIPTMDPKGPKYWHRTADGREHGWFRHKARFAAALSPHVRYYSAFVTRPDSAPWIDTREFAELFERVWAGKLVAVVAKRSTKILPLAHNAASEVVHIDCPEREAYAEIDRLEAAVVAAAPDVALLSAGPTATVLAHRLCKRGIQAIDMGSAGAFLCRLLDA